jgi:lipopolysaccharide export system protein LptC
MSLTIPWRIPAGIVALALLAWIGFEIGRAGSDIVPPRIATQSTLNRGVVTGKRVDGRSWSLNYDTATLSPDGSQTTIPHVRSGRIRAAGKPDVVFTADDVTANSATNDFSVHGEIDLSQQMGPGHLRTLKTVGAQYAGATHTLTLENPVTLTDGPVTITVAHATVDFRTGATTLGRIIAVKPGTRR